MACSGYFCKVVKRDKGENIERLLLGRNRFSFSFCFTCCFMSKHQVAFVCFINNGLVLPRVMPPQAHDANPRIFSYVYSVLHEREIILSAPSSCSG